MPAPEMVRSVTVPAEPVHNYSDALLHWLADDMGIARRRADQFIRATGCYSKRNMALFLRMQLAPLDTANDNSVLGDLSAMLGCSWAKGRKLLEALHVHDALELEIEEAITTSLSKTLPLGLDNSRFSLHAKPRYAITAEVSLTSKPSMVLECPSHEASDPASTSDGKSGEKSGGRSPAKADTDKAAPLPTSYTPESARHMSVPPTPRAFGYYQPNAQILDDVSVDITPRAKDLADLGIEGEEATLDAIPVAPSSALGDTFALDQKLRADEGAYNYANVELRKNVPHYDVDTRPHVFWSYIVLYVLCFAAAVLYLGMRAFYLASGRTADMAALDSGQNISVTYSWVFWACEVATTFVSFVGSQTFVRQKPKFTPIKDLPQDTPITQTVHVIVTTYSEPAETVRECVMRLLVAPEPAYMEKLIYVADDGYAKSEGPKKRRLVSYLRAMGHKNVFYVGDRVKKPHQLNGKSANLNHVLMNHIFPGVKVSSEIPEQHIMMVMDCDHMAKPAIFRKMGSVMRDANTAVALAPQWFHNLISPDCFDSANADFMFAKNSYYFGQGMCYITGTNFMLRARVAYECAEFSARNPKHNTYLDDGTIQVLSEDQISEDIELGMRVCALGYHSVMIPEVLATGEVPEDPRDMWRQRLRWCKGGHLFLVKNSHVIFSLKGATHQLSFYHKTLYALCPMMHFFIMWAHPIMITMPLVCLGFDTCPYGIDEWLFVTHFIHFTILSLRTMWQPEWWLVKNSFGVITSYTVLYWTNCKAAINLIMVQLGYKPPGKFKATAKAGANRADHNLTSVSGALAPADGKGSAAPGTARKGCCASFEFRDVHDALSKVSDQRRRCMPFDGTFDLWILVGFTLQSLIAACIGTADLLEDGRVWSSASDADAVGQNTKWIAVVFGFMQAAPGLLFMMYMLVWDSRYASLVMSLWMPFIVGVTAVALAAIEIGLLVFYINNGTWSDL